MPRLYYSILILTLLTVWNNVRAEQDVVCAAVNQPAQIDGIGDDTVWLNTTPVITRDVVAHIDHEVHCVYTEKQIFIKVKFSDADENREHKSLIWDPEEQRYAVDWHREDTLVLKWNMEPLFTDISLSADDVYRADIWYWKSSRSDHAGFADDKMHIYSDQSLQNSTRLLSKSGRRFYLLRSGDEGRSAYKAVSPAAFESDHLISYKFRQPSGSRADVRAKGHWSEGNWTIEFARDLITGHADDVQISAQRRYQFGISRYEIAGRAPQPSIQVPLFASGDVGEDLILILADSQMAQQ